MPQLPQPKPLKTEITTGTIQVFEFHATDGDGYFRISVVADDKTLGAILTAPNLTAQRIQDRDIPAIVEGLRAYLTWRESL